MLARSAVHADSVLFRDDMQAVLASIVTRIMSANSDDSRGLQPKLRSKYVSQHGLKFACFVRTTVAKGARSEGFPD